MQRIGQSGENYPELHRHRKQNGPAEVKKLRLSKRRRIDFQGYLFYSRYLQNFGNFNIKTVFFSSMTTLHELVLKQVGV